MLISILPGDVRQGYLSALLRADGHETIPYAPGQAADAYLFPLPTGAHPALAELPPDSLALVGKAVGKHQSLRLRDYFAPEAVQVLNAAITAEGAIGLAIAHSPTTLWGAEALVSGYGRIGRALSRRLLALGCRVTVYARRPESRAWAEAEHCRTLETLPERVEGFAYVFNTVPEPIFRERPSGLCIELASLPGGFADPSGVLSGAALPGKTAPETAARVLKASIERILKEESVP